MSSDGDDQLAGLPSVAFTGLQYHDFTAASYSNSMEVFHPNTNLQSIVQDSVPTLITEQNDSQIVPARFIESPYNILLDEASLGVSPFDPVESSRIPNHMHDSQPWVLRPISSPLANQMSTQPALHDLSHANIYGQSGPSSMSPSSLISAHSPRTNLKEPTSLSDSDTVGMQALIPSPRWKQTVIQPISVGSSPNEHTILDPTGPSPLIPTPHPRLEANPPINHTRITRARKRGRSPASIKEEKLSATRRTLSKRTGIPECALDTFCIDSNPAPKRARTASQKREKKNVESAGGSCMLCRFLKQKVCTFS